METPIQMLGIAMINVPFYSMEIRHTICRHFKMIIGEMGPVEIELFFTLLFAISGGVFGVECYDKKLNDVFGVEWDFLRSYQLRHIIIMLTIVLLGMFTIDNLKDALSTNKHESFRLFVPVLVLLSFA